MSVQLTYALTTAPDPLQVNRANSSITIIASTRYSEAAHITSISVTIPIGSGTQSLASTATTIVAAGPAGWEISGNATQGSFIFTPPDEGDSGLSSGLVFTFSNITVNSSAGSAQVTIEENNTPSDTYSFEVSKFPADFYLNPMTSNPAEINAGQTSTLSWSGAAGYSYVITPTELLSQTVDPTTNAGSVETVPLSENTIFTLTVSNGNNQGSAVAQETAGVTVNPPTISTFMINGSTNLTGVNMGDTLNLSWTATNADHVLILVDSQAVGFFDAGDTSATLEAILGGNYRAVAYFGEISGGIHSPPSDAVGVSLNPPSAVLSVSPTWAYADYNSVTLTWTTQNATSAKLQCGASAGDQSVALAASDYPVYPQGTTDYKITAIYSPDEATGLLPNAALKVPSSMLDASQSASGYQETEVTQTLTMKASSLQIVTDSFTPGGSNTHTLTTPATQAVSYIGGFKYNFSKNKKHDLLKWQVTGTASLDAAGTSLSTGCTMILEDNSDNNINSDATLETVTVCWNEEDTSSFLQLIKASSGTYNFSLPGIGYETVAAGMTSFAFWSKNTGHDGKVRKMDIQVDQPESSDITPDTTTDTTNAYIYFTGHMYGKQSYYYSLSFAPLATIDNPTGSGFATAVVDEGTASVRFAQPVKAAYTFLCYWADDGSGDGNEHTIQLLQSDYVSTIVSGSTVTLNWGTSKWEDGSDGSWAATRQIIVLATFDNISTTVAPN